MTRAKKPELKEDMPGSQPSGITGAREKGFFDAGKGDHDHRMRKLELGKIGEWIGGEKNAPITIAFVCIVASIILAVGCTIVAGLHPEAQELWGRMFERSLSFMGVIIAYLFGRGSKSS